MKSIVLFGAGQVGAMVSRLLGADYSVSCFADNSSGKWGTVFCGFPVVSPEESLSFAPECFCLCVLDAERAGQMEAQLRSLGFDGEILRPDALVIFSLDQRLTYAEESFFAVTHTGSFWKEEI